MSVYYMQTLACHSLNTRDDILQPKESVDSQSRISLCERYTPTGLRWSTRRFAGSQVHVLHQKWSLEHEYEREGFQVQHMFTQNSAPFCPPSPSQTVALSVTHCFDRAQHLKEEETRALVPPVGTWLHARNLSYFWCALHSRRVDMENI